MSKVLIIDDEALLRESVAAYLEDDGYQVLATATADTALSQLSGFQPDVVVVDLRLEGGSGEDFIKSASECYSGAHYIIHTACKDYRLPPEMQTLGMDDQHILYKPLRDLSALSGLIGDLLQRQAPASRPL